MSRASSPSTARRYGTARVCQLWEVPRSTVYERRARASRPVQPAAKRGPKAGLDGRGADRADPRGAHQLAVPRRGLPQGLGAAAPGPACVLLRAGCCG